MLEREVVMFAEEYPAAAGRNSIPIPPGTFFTTCLVRMALALCSASQSLRT